MSKPSAVFSRTPIKSVLHSPVSNRSNSAKTASNNSSTPSTSDPSPRKCKIQTEIQSSPSFGQRVASVNVKSKFQFNCPMSPKIAQEKRMTKPSPRSEQKINEEKAHMKTVSSKQKLSTPTGVKAHNSTRENSGSASKQRPETDSAKTDLPNSINVKTMRSCFEHKENRVPSRPPPSPSPSRAKSRLADAQPVTPRNNNGIKGILSTRSKYNSSPTVRIPTGNSTSTPRPGQLRRSVSASSINRSNNTPRGTNLTRCSSQTITPKHRVKFQDDTAPECFSPVLLESKGDHGSGESIGGEVTNLTVAVRVRPPFQGERSVVSMENNSVRVKAMGSEHCFSYEYCFDPASSQQCVFNTLVMPLVEVAFQGYNVCLFAYGQTGTGKTYSMMGEDISHYNITDTAGIIPRFSQELFKIIEGSEEYSHTKVEISYFEIYNEKIHDLLGPSQNGRSAPLRVREHPELGPYVVDLTVHSVHSFETLQDWLNVGNSHRETAATEINMNSSRSHSIFTVTLTQSQVDDRPSLCSKINLIDLAGSERLAHSCVSGDRLKEGVSINRSLLTLGKVISSLAEKKKRGFIPYRESVLTWLLRESLGGNSRTAMLATISPCARFVDETLSTLRYACQARNIVNTVRINESPHEKRIRELLEEIQKLKEEVEIKDHSECMIKQKNLQCQLNQVTEDLERVNFLYSQSDAETEKLISELSKIKQISGHEECEKKVNQLLKDLDESSNWIIKYENEILDLKRSLYEANNKVESCQEQNIYLEQKLEHLNEKYQTEIHNVQKLKEEFEQFGKANNKVESYRDQNIYLEQKMEHLNEKYQTEIHKVQQLEEELENFVKANNKVKSYQEQNIYLEQKLEHINEKYQTENLRVQKLAEELEIFENNMELYKKDNSILQKELQKAKNKNINYEKDLAEMKNLIVEIKKNSSHDHCDSQILLLQTALAEAERFNLSYKEKIQTYEKKNVRFAKPSKHSGCEKEINALKCTISELKKSSEHEKCESVIEKLKMALTEAEELVIDLENEISKLKEENTILKENNKQNEVEISSLKSSMKDVEKHNSHVECEERINVLKKALSVARSINVHVQCENRISELETKLLNSQSVNIADHTKCDEKNNTLFFTLEKYAADNIKLRESHQQEIVQFKETIQTLENQISKLTTVGSKSRKSFQSRQDIAQLETQARSIKEENSRIKKKRVDDEKKISSLEEQVISLTKDLLNVKSQLRIISREKESSESLCTQLQEQLLQQDRKLAVTQSRKQLFSNEDKENQNSWETPTKVIRRSIARYSNSNKQSERCSLVTKAEDIHQAVKEAGDICTRLKIPWVFCLEPEVTTHSWFDVNIRVFDQRTTNSVRWPQEVFLGWLRDMKEEIMSKTSGPKMFQSATWLQKTKSKDIESLPSELAHNNKSGSLQDHIEKVRSQLKDLENLGESKEKQEILSALSALGKSVTEMKIKLASSSPLQPAENNLRL